MQYYGLESPPLRSTVVFISTALKTVGLALSRALAHESGQTPFLNARLSAAGLTRSRPATSLLFLLSASSKYLTTPLISIAPKPPLICEYVRSKLLPGDHSTRQSLQLSGLVWANQPESFFYMADHSLGDAELGGNIPLGELVLFSVAFDDVHAENNTLRIIYSQDNTTPRQC